MAKAPARITNRNPHTGDKLQSKMNTDVGVESYMANYDSIFGRKCIVCKDRPTGECERINCPEVTFILAEDVPEYCRLPVEKAENSDGFYGTETHISNRSANIGSAPPWATHVYWY